MANVTKQMEQNLVTSIQDISNSTKDLEIRKMDIQMDIFIQSMDYKCIRDEYNG